MCQTLYLGFKGDLTQYWIFDGYVELKSSAECCGYNQTSRKYFESQSVYFFDKRKRKAHLIKTFCIRRAKFVQICVTQQVDVICKFGLICQHSEVSGDSKKNMTGNTSSPANLYHPSVILNKLSYVLREVADGNVDSVHGVFKASA